MNNIHLTFGYKKRLKTGLSIFALYSLAACSVVGPNFEPVDTVKLPESWSKSDTEKAELMTEQWWKQFNDPTLNRLVDAANQQNLDIEAAGLRILQARMVYGISDALSYPQVQVVSGQLAKIYTDDKSYNNAALSFDAGWEMDVWGKYARGLESAEAALYASIASYNNITVSITAEVARNYVNYRTFQERVLLSQRNIQIQERVVEITQVQYDSGNVTELDVQQAKSQLYGTQSALPALQIGMKKARNALAVLLGILPTEVDKLLASDEIAERIESYLTKYDNSDAKRASANNNNNSLVPIPPIIDTSIDASLVLRRPDLQVAELQAHAQSAKIGVAEAALYPSFSLFGSIGVNSTEESATSFSLSDSLTLAVGPTFSWNVFQYGRVKNNIRLEDARFQETLTNYNKKILQAIQEVGDSLSSYQYYQTQEALRLKAVNASVRAFNISMTQYENGQINFERLLSSVEKMTRSEDSHAQTKGNIANQVIALYKSLGGGWEANSGKAFISDALIETMKSRTDWGDQLDNPQTLPTQSYSPERSSGANSPERSLETNSPERSSQTNSPERSSKVSSPDTETAQQEAP
ncbi:TolC family protein [Alkalimarinus sediminis]